MDISRLNKADVLAALYNNSRPSGIGILHFTPERMSREEAQELLDEIPDNKYFDYVKGRAMKIDLSTDELDTRLYNRDNGTGAAERVLVGLLGGIED